jgi:hypothetical protein
LEQRRGRHQEFAAEIGIAQAHHAARAEYAPYLSQRPLDQSRLEIKAIDAAWRDNLGQTNRDGSGAAFDRCE